MEAPLLPFPATSLTRHSATPQIGTDIQDAKCSWLVVRALETASPEQRATLKVRGAGESDAQGGSAVLTAPRGARLWRAQVRYGKDNAEDIAAIKDLYKALGLEKAFEEYESESYAKLQKLIEQEPEELLRQAYRELLGKIYKRAK